MNTEILEIYLRELYNSPELRVGFANVLGEYSHFTNVLGECTYAVQFQRKKSSPGRELHHNRLNEYLKWEEIYFRKQKIQKICTKLGI